MEERASRASWRIRRKKGWKRNELREERTRLDEGRKGGSTNLGVLEDEKIGVVVLEQEVEVESDGLLSRKDLPEVGDEDVLVLEDRERREGSERSAWTIHLARDPLSLKQK